MRVNSKKAVTYLAVDVGTHAVRAALVHKGVIGEVFSQAVDLQAPLPHHVEQQPQQLFNALLAVCKRALAGHKFASVVLGMAVQRSSVMAWHATTAQPLSPVISWQDTRGHALIDQLTPHMQATLKDITGLQPSAHYGASKLAGMQPALLVANSPFIFGPLAAWLIACLTHNLSAPVVDAVNAARTLLLNRQTLLWDVRLCTHFGVNPSFLPVVVPSYHGYGDVPTLGGAKAKLQAVLGDQNAAYLAMRCGQLPSDVNYINPLVVNLGSGAFVLGDIDGSVDYGHLGLLTSLAYSNTSQQRWMLEGTVNGAGTAISAWCQSVGLTDADFFNQLPAWQAAQLAHPAEDYYFLNTSAGIGSPFWVHHFNVRSISFLNAVGQAVVPSIPQQALAVIESIAFLVVANILQLGKSGSHYDGIIATGGLSRVDGLLSMIANLSNMPILAASCHEATLQGAALLASNFTFKPRIDGRVISCVPASTDLRRRYLHYCQLIREQAQL